MHEVGTVEDLVAEVQDHEDDHTDVRDKEIGDVEGGDPGGESLGQDDQDTEEKAVPGQIGLEGGLVGQSITRDVARLEGTHESQVTQTDGRPADESSHTGDINQPVEDLSTGLGDVHEPEKTEGGREGNADIGYTAVSDPAEDRGRELLLGQTEEHTTATVDVGVSSREDDSQEDGVDQTGKDLHAGELRGDDHRRGRGVAGVGDQVGVVVGDQQAHEEDGQDEEDKNTDEGLADGRGDGLLGILCFTSRDTNQLGTLIGETSLHKHGPETDELGNWI